MSISSKGRLYAVSRASGETQSDSAKIAGYAHPDSVCARLEADPHIQEYLMELTEKISNERIATATERQQFWTSVLRAEEASGTDQEGNDTFDMKDRLKASELLGKSQMDFVEKKIVTIVNPADELERLKELAILADD